MEESKMQDVPIMPKQKPFTSIVTFHFDYKWMFPMSFNSLSSYCTFLQFIPIKTDNFFSAQFPFLLRHVPWYLQCSCCFCGGRMPATGSGSAAFCHCYPAGHINSAKHLDSILLLCRRTQNSCVKTFKLFCCLFFHVRLKIKGGLADSLKNLGGKTDAVLIPLIIEGKWIYLLCLWSLIIW